MAVILICRDIDRLQDIDLFFDCSIDCPIDWSSESIDHIFAKFRSPTLSIAADVGYGYLFDRPSVDY